MPNRGGDQAMITQCAWCGHVLGQSPPLEDKRITHGICLPCFDGTCAAAAPEVEKPAARVPARRTLQTLESSVR